MIKHPKYHNRVQVKFSELCYGDRFWYRSNLYKRDGIFITPPFWAGHGKGNKQGAWHFMEKSNSILLSPRIINGEIIDAWHFVAVKISEDTLVWKEV